MILPNPAAKLEASVLPDADSSTIFAPLRQFLETGLLAQSFSVTSSFLSVLCGQLLIF